MSTSCLSRFKRDLLDFLEWKRPEIQEFLAFAFFCAFILLFFGVSFFIGLFAHQFLEQGA